MKGVLRLISIAILALTSCSNQQPGSQIAENKQVKVNPQDEFSKLNDFLKKFDVPAQTFKAPSGKLIKVTGKHGTIIHINPADLEMENGEPPGKDIDIELKELSSQEHLLRANAQTISDGQLLVSGGAYYINLTSSGQKVKLKEGKSYSVEFVKLSDYEMTLFYGQRDSSGKMNWNQTDQKFIIPGPAMDSPKEYVAVIVTGKGRFTDTSTTVMKNLSKDEYEKAEKEIEINNKVYNPVALNKFGWINCDRFYEPEAPRTLVQFTIANKPEEVNYVKVYLVFKDIKSVLQSSAYTWDTKIDKGDFYNIPLGMSVKFFAVGYQGGKIFASLSDDMKVTSNQNELLTLHEHNEIEFDNLMNAIE